jgi:hypothetical protein
VLRGFKNVVSAARDQAAADKSNIGQSIQGRQLTNAIE